MLCHVKNTDDRKTNVQFLGQEAHLKLDQLSQGAMNGAGPVLKQNAFVTQSEGRKEQGRDHDRPTRSQTMKLAQLVE